MRLRRGYAAVLGAVMAVGVMAAQVPNASSGEENHALGKVVRAEGSPDQIFLQKAIEGANGVIDAAKLALRRSKNDQIKRYAQQMVDDHTKMLGELRQVEQGQTLKYKDTTSATARTLHARLMPLKGRAFDKAYVNGMVKDHEGDVREFTKEAETGKDAAIKGVAERSLPTMKEHLEMVQGLQKTIGA